MIQDITEGELAHWEIDFQAGSDGVAILFYQSDRTLNHPKDLRFWKDGFPNLHPVFHQSRQIGGGIFDFAFRGSLTHTHLFPDNWAQDLAKHYED